MSSLGRSLALGAIRSYQKHFSRVLPRACRFYPSCSEYTAQAIEKYGLLRGGRLGMARIVRCHPFNPGGVDYLK